MAIEDNKNLDPVYYRALDGNVKEALKILNDLPLSQLNAEEKEIRQKYIRRFTLPYINPLSDRLVDRISAAYQAYWHKALLQELSPEQGHDFLFQELAPMVKALGGGINKYSEAEYDRVAEFLKLKLKEEGYFSLIGEVSPFLNFMAWKTEETKNYSVHLGDGEIEKVDVILLNNFASLGWAAYATFEKMHVGGWVGKSALYCVAQKYDLESDNFKVSFLGHEARHFADLKKYPTLKSLDLEYRAKLNELILAKTPRTLLHKFLMEQKNNPKNPHSHASFHLITRLTERLKPQEWEDETKIQTMAGQLLRENSALLSKHKPSEVLSAFP